MPGGAEGARAFCRRAIAAAGPACVAAKLQLASFERFGTAGWEAFERVAAAAADAGLLVIADAKRGDVDVTSRAYAEAFLRPPIDAMTVNPVLGGDALAPFLEAATAGGRGLFALVRTSNPGAAELQDLPLASGGLWHEEVARRVAGWGAASVDRSGLSALGAVVRGDRPRAAGTPARADAGAAVPDPRGRGPGRAGQGSRPRVRRPAGRSAGRGEPLDHLRGIPPQGGGGTAGRAVEGLRGSPLGVRGGGEAGPLAGPAGRGELAQGR